MSEETVKQFHAGNIIFDEKNTPVYVICAKGKDPESQEVFYSVKKLPNGKPAVISEKDLTESVAKLQSKFDEISSGKKEFYLEFTQHNKESEEGATEKLRAFFVQEFGESFTRCFRWNQYNNPVKQLGTDYSGARNLGYEKEVPSVLKLDSKHPYNEHRGWGAPKEEPGSIFVSKEGYAKLVKLATTFREKYTRMKNTESLNTVYRAFAKFLQKQKHGEYVEVSGYSSINVLYSPGGYNGRCSFPIYLREDLSIVVG